MQYKDLTADRVKYASTHGRSNKKRSFLANFHFPKRAIEQKHSIDITTSLNIYLVFTSNVVVRTYQD